MKRIAGFLEFNDTFVSMNENVNKAKEILYSKYAKDKGKKLEDLTPDEKMKIEGESKFVKVKEEIGAKNPRLIYPFTKFYVIDGAPWEALIELVAKYLSANPGPKSLRLGPIENYAELPSESDPPPYTQLDQDLDAFIEGKESRSKEPKVIVDKKPKQLRPEIRLLIEYYAKAKKIDPSEVTPEEIEKMENNPKYLRLKEEFLSKYPGLLPMYVKFHLVEKEPFEKIVELNNRLEEVKPQPGELQAGEGNLSDYLDLDKKKYPTPGAETLIDHLNELVKRRLPKKLLDLFSRDMGPDSIKRDPKGLRRMRWVYDQLVRSDKKEDKKKIEDLVFIATRLQGLPEKEVYDKELRAPVIRGAWTDFVKKSSKYNDYYPKPENDFCKGPDDCRGNNLKPGQLGGTYPDFIDPFFAFSQMIQDGFNLIEGWSSGIVDLKNKIVELQPKTGILYDDNNYLVTSARTYEGIVEVCKIVGGSHCIQNGPGFWGATGGGRIQLSISDFNVKPSDPRSLFTMTLEQDGTFSRGAGSPNDEGNYSKYRGKPFTDVLRILKYPDSLISTCANYFPREQRIKKALEIFFKIAEGNYSNTPKKTSKSPETGVKGIMNNIHVVHDELIAGTMNESQWNQISSAVADIVFDKMGITTNDIVNFFKKYGVSYISDFIIFKQLVKNNYTKGDADAIRESTIEYLEEAESAVDDKEFMEALGRNRGKIYYSMVENKDKLIELVNSL